MLVTLDYTIRIGSTPTFLYLDLYPYPAYAAHYVYLAYSVHGFNLRRSRPFETQYRQSADQRQHSCSDSLRFARFFIISCDWLSLRVVLIHNMIGQGRSFFRGHVNMAEFAEAQWNLAFEEVKNQFKLADILPEQQESIR